MDGTESARTQIGQEYVLERLAHNSVWSHTHKLVFPGGKVPIYLLSGLPQGIRKISSWSVLPPAPGMIDAKYIKDGKRQNKVLPMS